MNEFQLRLVRFSVGVIELAETLYKDYRVKFLTNQVVRSAGSIGANYSEAQSASSQKDYHNKIRIALKEARETEYWLMVAKERFRKSRELPILIDEIVQIIRILSAMAKKSLPDGKTRINK